MRKRLRAYLMLTKPGIVTGNAIHVIAGALFASTIAIPWTAVVGVVIGTMLVVASACVVNNYMDRSIDERMKRTVRRPSVTGEVSVLKGMTFAVLLLVAGSLALVALTNGWVVLIGAIAYIFYVFIYAWAKRHTVYSTIIGAVPGALPAMAGYVCVTGELTVGAWLLFLLTAVWQMPHFYAISLYRRSEYKAARLPVLGVVRPFATVRMHILVYLMVYVAVIAAIISSQIAGVPSGLILLAGAAYWLYVFWQPIKTHESWARSVFAASLVVSLITLVAAVLNVYFSPYQ